VAFSPDGRRALWGGDDTRLHVWDLAAGKELAALGKDVHRGSVIGLALSPDGSRALACADRTVHVWRLGAPAAVAAKKVEDPVLARDLFEGHKEIVWAVAAAPGGRLVLSAGGGTSDGKRGGDHDVLLWDPQTLRTLARLGGHTDNVRGAAVARTGRLAATASLDATVRLWDLQGHKPAGVLTLHIPQPLGQVVAVAFTPDDKRVISGGSALVLWDVRKRAALYRFATPPVFIHSVAVAPNGGLLLSGDNEGGVRLWSLKTYREVRQFRGHTGRVAHVGFSADGKRAFTVSGWKDSKGKLAPGEDDTIRVWEVSTGKQLKRIDGTSGPFECGALSPDGRLLATGGFDAAVRLWDLESGREVTAFRGHRSGVTSVAFLPGGRRLLSASRDGTVRIWQLPEPAAP
jgi:WD40 repeat protein